MEHTSRQLSVSLAQIPVAAGDPARNLETAAQAVGEAARRGSALVVLPELWTTGMDLRAATEEDILQDVDAVAAMCDLARTNRVAVAGSVLLREGARFYNTLLLVSAEGEIIGRYRKMHVFAPMDEHRYVTPGEQPVVCAAPWGATGLAVCYDLRFPELFRRLVDDGAQVLLLPAEWPYPRLEHWRTLLRARAIENQCVVIATNATGMQGPYHFCGHSAIVDPWGQTVVEAGDDETILTVTVDLQQVTQVRESFPVLRDRRIF